jgi:folate-binding protein YgfZ
VDLEEAAGADVRLVADRPDPRVVVGDADVATELSIDVFEAWRVRRGLARFPVDLDADSTPAEAGLDRLVDVTKGCFLGQEAVAKIRNLGHPARVVVAMSAPAGAAPGDTVSVGGRAVGTITSAARADGSTAVIARVAWKDRDADLTCPAGSLMRR